MPDLTLDIPAWGLYRRGGSPRAAQFPRAGHGAVHGCKARPGGFCRWRSCMLSRQQAVCFSYDDRASLVRVSGELIAALDGLAGHMHNRQLTVMGHSMGGLVSERHWSATARAWNAPTWNCGYSPSRRRSPASALPRPAATAGAMAEPGVVPASARWYRRQLVRDHLGLDSSAARAAAAHGTAILKIVTDERGHLPALDANGAVSRAIMSSALGEQYQPVVTARRLTNVEVDAGHVEIVGDRNIVPRSCWDSAAGRHAGPDAAERRVALERFWRSSTDGMESDGSAAGGWRAVVGSGASRPRRTPQRIV